MRGRAGARVRGRAGAWTRVHAFARSRGHARRRARGHAAGGRAGARCGARKRTLRKARLARCAGARYGARSAERARCWVRIVRALVVRVPAVRGRAVPEAFEPPGTLRRIQSLNRKYLTVFFATSASDHPELSVQGRTEVRCHRHVCRQICRLR